MTGAPAPASLYGRLALVSLFWGGTFIAGRVVAESMAAPTAAFWRYLCATAALLALLFVRERGMPAFTTGQWLAVAGLGVTGVALYNLLFMAGLASVPASRGALIMALNPAITLIASALFLREPLTLARIAGIVVALLGVAIELGHGNPLALVAGGIGRGELLIFGCALSWAAYALISRRWLQGASPLAANTGAAVFGTTLLGVVAAASGDLVLPRASGTVWLALVYMGVLGTAISFVWYFEGVQKLGPARTSIFLNLVPVTAILLGVLLLGERFEWPMAVGTALVLAGVYIINRPGPAVAAAAPATSRG